MLKSIISALAITSVLSTNGNFTIPEGYSSILGSASMDCSTTASGNCGVLTVETGYGTGVYNHPDKPRVHGLWPEVSPYGNANCMAPADTTPPDQVYECYNIVQTSSDMTPLQFEQHEWSSHGICSGTQNANDFFTQLCKLASGPVSVMEQSDRTLASASQALVASGYEIFSTDTRNAQLQLTLCLLTNGQWIFSNYADFATNCV